MTTVNQASTSQTRLFAADPPAYTVQKGDTLSDIAARHNISLAALQRANPQVAGERFIFPGDRLVIPADNRPLSYVVQRGETLSSIAKEFKTDWRAIADSNRLSNPDRISPGQVLRIQAGRSPEQGPSPSTPEAPPPRRSVPGQTGPIATRLPASGPGFVTYNREAGGADQVGRSGFVADLQALALAWSRTGRTPVSFGDISREGGGRFAPHSAHRSGNEVDMRPIRKDGRNLPSNVNDASYDRVATRQFIQLVRSQHPGAVILFNDPVLRNEGLVRFARGHDNHLHIKF